MRFVKGVNRRFVTSLTVDMARVVFKRRRAGPPEARLPHRPQGLLSLLAFPLFDPLWIDFLPEPASGAIRAEGTTVS